MVGNKSARVWGIILIIMGMLVAFTLPALGQVGLDKAPIEGWMKKDWRESDIDYSGGVKKHRKQPIVAGIPLGAKRSEITRLYTGRHISAQQRTVPMDTFPRLMGEISYIQKAYLYYTKDRVSKIKILFSVPIETKSQSGDSLFDFYKELRKNLVKIYGQPTNNTDYVHPNFSYRLVALETGNATLFDYWENVDDLKILLSLTGKDQEIEFSLSYQYIPLFEEQ